jgi:aspartyl-tRNA(Asn)/glutamyl-tRNA(Gln) amidotransferase subunit B
MTTNWQAVIGLEVHVQLQTKSKIFSGSSTAFGAPPNTQASLVDLGFPGTLPLLNHDVVRLAIAFGLATNATISPRSVFARKNYFYPDLPKGYQISQLDLPIVAHGSLPIRLEDGREKIVEIIRAHLEEDAGKSVHDEFAGASGIDLNRAGTPLLEVVTSPCLFSASEAVAYLKALYRLVTTLEICDGNLQEGSFRCDANVSVHKPGTPLGTRSEIKNVNSFRFVEKAIDYEIERQIRLLENGESVRQETRLFDAARGETRSMRSKEDAHDYRYFPDPDLPPLHITTEQIEQVKQHLPEFPQAKRARFIAELGLAESDAEFIVFDIANARYFEAMLRAGAPAKAAANWISGELAATLNETGIDINNARVKPADLAGLLQEIDGGALSLKMAKPVFAKMWSDGLTAAAAISALGLKQINDDSALITLIDGVLAANPAQTIAFQSGEEKMFQYLMGQVMRVSKGQANPAKLQDLLRARLSNIAK